MPSNFSMEQLYSTTWTKLTAITAKRVHYKKNKNKIIIYTKR